MLQNTPLTTATTTNHQSLWEGTIPLLIKRIFLTLAITAVFVTSATVTWSAGRKSSTVNKPVLAVSDCQKVKGIESVVNNGDGTTSGTITQGGKLNGTVG